MDFIGRERHIEQAAAQCEAQLKCLLEDIAALIEGGFFHDPRVGELMDEAWCIYADYDIQRLCYLQDLERAIFDD